MPPVSVIPDEEAALLSGLVDRHYTGVFAYLYRLVADRNLAQDLASQVFLPPRADRRRLAHAADPRAWLYRRATELAGAQKPEAMRRQRWLRWRRPPAEPMTSRPDDLRWGQPGPLQVALAALPFRERAALLLHGHHGLSLNETAAALAVSPAAVRRLLNAARQVAHATYVQDAPVPAVPAGDPGTSAGADAPRDAGRLVAAGPLHEQVSALLPAYAGLPEAQQALVAGHVGECPECAGQLGLYRRIDHELAALPDAWASRHAQNRLYAAVKTPVEETAPAARPSRPAPGVVLLAVVAVLAVAGAWFGGQGKLAPAVAAAGRVGSPTPEAATATPSAIPTVIAAAQPSREPIAEQLPAGMTAQDVAWLKRNAIPFNTTEPGSSSPIDLVPLKQIVGNARIVGLADSSYGTKELMGVKQRVLEFLVQEMSFNTLAVDSSWPQAELLNDYLQTGQGDPQRLALLLTGGYRQSPDLLNTIEWLRAHNQDPLGIPKVTFHGFDTLQTYSHIPLDSLASYLQVVDPGALALLQGDNQELFQHIVANRADYVSKSSFTEYNVALRNARALGQYDAYAATGDPAARALLRSQFMAENVLGMLRGFGGGNRIVLWGQAADLGVDNQAGNLGAILRQRFGSNYVVIDLDFSQGSLDAASTARTAGAPEPIETHRIAPPPAGTYEDYLRLAGLPYFMLDLRPARPAGSSAPLGAVPSYLYRGGGGGFPGGGGGGGYPGGAGGFPGVDGTRGLVPYLYGGTPGPGSLYRGPGGGTGGRTGAAGAQDSAATPAAPEDTGPAPTPTTSPTPEPPLQGTSWLQGPHLTHDIRGAYNDCEPEAQFTSMRLAEVFDAVIYVQDVSPAATLFQTTGAAKAQCPSGASAASAGQ